MSGESPFEVEGLIVDVLTNGTYRVRLANGHTLLGFLVGSAKRAGLRLRAGERVRLAVSPYDLSEGRIIIEVRE